MKITGTSSVEEAADILSEFFSDVTIKMDKEGCLLKNKDGIKIISSVQNVKAIDATGAGDAFMSGFIYGLYHHYRVYFYCHTTTRSRKISNEKLIFRLLIICC